jgi:hypothetical protein
MPSSAKPTKGLQTPLPRLSGAVNIWTYLFRNCANAKATSAEVS